jgi:hypothetical protein
MKTHSLFIAAASCMLFVAGAANADDHLFQAEQNGLKEGSQGAAHSNAFTVNPAGRSGDLAPGQGSPFTGEDTQTPATDTEAANEHANVKDR